MTVSYTAQVATAGFGTFGRLLFRWKASVHKLVWRETLIFVVFYAVIAILYHQVLSCEQRKNFSAFAKYCSDNSKIIPLTFVMGFFVNLIIDRWWSILMTIGWPDRACFYIAMCLSSNDDPEIAETRRAIARYLNLAQLLVLCDVSTSVKTRFPDLDKVIKDGFMTPAEKEIIEKVKSEPKLGKHNKYWLIIQWACNLLCRSHDKNKVRDQFSFTKAFDEIADFRNKLGLMLAYDWVCVPLSYTQVVTLVVYAYFVTSLIGRQYFDTDERCGVTSNLAGNGTMNSTVPTICCCPKSDAVNAHYRLLEKYFPIFPALEFLFYMGWLKVAESIMNPLGQDDDDFEINYIIDRNLAVSYGIVDSYRDTCPQVSKECLPQPAASKVKTKSYRGSATDYEPSDNPDGTAKPITLRKRKTRRRCVLPEGAMDESLLGPPMSPAEQLSNSFSKGSSMQHLSLGASQSPGSYGPKSKGKQPIAT